MAIFAYEIRRTENSIRFIANELSSLRQDVERLKRTKNRLLLSFEKFIDRQKEISKPSLTKDTWQGELANEFLMYRQYELKGSYLTIPHDQLTKRIEQIEQKISQLEATMINLENQLQAKRTQLSYLRSKQREALT